MKIHFSKKPQMKQFILLSIILLSIQVYAQTEEKRGLQCDSIIFMDGTAKLVQVKEVNLRKVIYILCCHDCAVPREFKKNEIDTIIYFQDEWIDQQSRYLNNVEKNKETTTLQVDSKSGKMNNNAIYGNLGAASIVGVWASATIYYERILNHDRVIKPFLKGGVGGYALWGEGGFFLLTSYGILTGRKSSHFEISAGVNWFLNGDLQGDYKYNALTLLSATIGYRYQKPGKRFIFRTGVSTPEGVYFGVGRSF
jgi:hypothetical protein